MSARLRRRVFILFVYEEQELSHLFLQVFDDLAPLVFELFPRAGDREAALVEELADAEDDVDVLSSIDALIRSGFLGAEGGELGLPETEDAGGDARDLGDLADLEVRLVGDVLSAVRPGRRSTPQGD